MKKLILVRHGRAEEGSAGITDFERSLTTKGKVISKLIAGKLRSEENPPFTLITSPAFRAIETALIFAGELGTAADQIIIDSSIYSRMNLRYLAEMLSGEHQMADSVILFGHNPSFTEIANSLCTEGCDFLPKSGAVGISFDITTWEEIRHVKGRQDFFIKPDRI